MPNAACHERRVPRAPEREASEAREAGAPAHDAVAGGALVEREQGDGGAGEHQGGADAEDRPAGDQRRVGGDEDPCATGDAEDDQAGGQGTADTPAVDRPAGDGAGDGDREAVGGDDEAGGGAADAEVLADRLEHGDDGGAGHRSEHRSEQQEDEGAGRGES
jgi:hypothetical protein